MLHNVTKIIKDLNQVRPYLNDTTIFKGDTTSVPFLNELFDNIIILIAKNDKNNLLAAIDLLGILSEKFMELTTVRLFSSYLNFNSKDYPYSSVTEFDYDSHRKVHYGVLKHLRNIKWILLNSL